MALITNLTRSVYCDACGDSTEELVLMLQDSRLDPVSVNIHPSCFNKRLTRLQTEDAVRQAQNAKGTTTRQKNRKE